MKATGETSIVLMTRASQMLAEADTIQKAKDLKNLALTAADWARRKGLGEEAVQHARSYALEAERRMGELLAARRDAGLMAKGGQPYQAKPTGTRPGPVEPTIADLGITKNESSQAQRLARVPREIFDKLLKKFKSPRATWAPILESLSPDWWTPAKYVDAAREVMGEIDLDPASCAEANKTVRANKFFSQENDGLSKSWTGRVFLNPPYGDLAMEFIEKFFNDLGSSFEEGILLVNSRATDADWFQPLFEGIMCFTNHRIDFESPGEKKTSSTHGSCFVYFGPHEKEFAEVFEQFGPIVRRWPRDD